MSEFIHDSPYNPDNLGSGDVAHILIPGYGRQNNGTELTPAGTARVDTAVALWNSDEMSPQRGFIVPSGYKSPGDSAGEPQRYPGNPKVYSGTPEAFLMETHLLDKGVDPAAIRPEPNSIDSATNVARSEICGYFGNNDDPVAIVAQEKHLDRIVRHIAPKLLRRPYVGVVVPEIPGKEVTDGLGQKLFSRAVLLGVNNSTPDVVKILDTRAARLWDIVLGAKRAKAAITGSDPDPHYHTAP